jgi:hypothetical protein
MTITTKTTKVMREHEETKTIAVKCDLCGYVDKRADHDGDGTIHWWGGSSYDEEQITISRLHGSAFPEGASLERESFDCCAKCWEEKIKPLFAAAGANPRVEDKSW